MSLNRPQLAKRLLRLLPNTKENRKVTMNQKGQKIASILLHNSLAYLFPRVVFTDALYLHNMCMSVVFDIEYYLYYQIRLTINLSSLKIIFCFKTV